MGQECWLNCTSGTSLSPFVGFGINRYRMGPYRPFPVLPEERTLPDRLGLAASCQTRKSPTETAFLRWGSHVFKKRLGADIVGQRKTERWTSQGSSALPWENAECKQKRSTTVTAR